jgi:multidrug transporter EmrE-like cation transporter
MFEDILKKIKIWSEKSILDEVIIIAVIISICEAIAQNFIRSNTNLNVFFGLSFYIIVGFLLHHAYNYYSLSKVNVIWSCISIIFATFLGYFIYKEHFTINNFISVFFATISIYFSSM